MRWHWYLVARTWKLKIKIEIKLSDRSIWFTPCFQSYMYPCSRKVPHLQPSWTTSVPWIYYALSWLHFFKFMYPLYLQPLFSTLLIILYLFFKTTHASFPLRSLPGNKSTTTQTLPPFLQRIRKAKIVHVSIMVLITLYSHLWLSCLSLYIRLRAPECKHTPCSSWCSQHLTHGRYSMNTIWMKEWINAWSIFFIFLLSLGTKFIG